MQNTKYPGRKNGNIRIQTGIGEIIIGMQEKDTYRYLDIKPALTNRIKRTKGGLMTKYQANDKITRQN